MGSLGGDISSLFINPAGLGLYKSRELVITPGMGFNNNHNDFRGTEAGSGLTRFQLGTCGFVWGKPGQTPSSAWKGGAWSLAVTKLADYNNHSYYQGLNNYSSYSEQYAEEASQSGKSIDDILNDPNYAFGTSLALDTYLVDTFSTAGGLQFMGLPELLLAKNISLLQQKTVDSKGGLSEVALGYGAAYKEKLYIGGNLGFPIIYANSTTTFTESASSPDPAGQFASSQLVENRITKGYGVYLRLGAIYKPDNNIRLGLALTSPSLIGITDSRSDTMVTNTGSYAGLRTAGSTTFLGGQDASVNYNVHTPWKALVSASYMFNAVEDVRQQRGFVTADLEYIRYPGTSFHAASGEGDNSAENAYHAALNGAIKQLYKGALNVKVGGELKLNTFLARAGVGLYGNPYQASTDLKAGKTVLSAGLGYRNFGLFVDLTYAYSIQKDVDFPYLLADKDNTYANLDNRRGSLLLTFGLKF